MLVAPPALAALLSPARSPFHHTFPSPLLLHTPPLLRPPAANYAFPTGSGYILDGVGWVNDITDVVFNCTTGSDPRTFYSTIDVTYLGVTTTSPRIYKQFTYDGCTATLTSAYTFPLLTAIITMEKGVPTYVAWDDGCYFCASNDASTCVPNAINGTYQRAQSADYMSCQTSMATCYPSTPTPSATPVATRSPTQTPTPSATPTASANASLASTPSPTPTSSNTSSSNVTIPNSSCDMKLFVVWSGSDASGQYYTSANKRFSRFRQFGTATVFQSAINIGLDGLTVAQTALGLSDGVPGRLLPGSNVRRRRLYGVDAGDSGVEGVHGHMRHNSGSGAAAAAASMEDHPSRYPAHFNAAQERRVESVAVHAGMELRAGGEAPVVHRAEAAAAVESIA